MHSHVPSTSVALDMMRKAPCDGSVITPAMHRGNTQFNTRFKTPASSAANTEESQKCGVGAEKGGDGREGGREGERLLNKQKTSKIKQTNKHTYPTTFATPTCLQV